MGQNVSLPLLKRWCSPPVPSQTVALEPEQQVGYAVVTAGYPVKPDLHNATDRAQPQEHDLGSERLSIRVVHCREHQDPQRLSCLAGPSAESNCSRMARILKPTIFFSSSSCPRARINSFARFRAAITATRSRPTTLPLSRISRILWLRSSAEASKSDFSSAGQATWYS